MARLEPLDAAPAPDAVADEVIARFILPYPYEAYTHVAGALAVTTDAPATGAAPLVDSTAVPDVLAPVRLTGARRTPTAAEIGDATHRVLLHLDFTRPCDREDIDAQIATAVERRLLDADQAKVVDADAIVWLVSSEVGQLFRNNAKALRRELPIYAAIPPAVPGTSGGPGPGAAPPAPLDQVMLRGRLDALLPLADRCILVDYKTDAVSAGQVNARLDLHRPQLAAYADAVAAMTGKPVRTVAVFLKPRVICEVEAS
jgi:ATP-dependent helicase/nuclease subunit A